jgi:L-fuconolactonase
VRCRDELTLLRTFVDKMGTGYATLWNAFKRITAGCSQIEKLALYSGTAKRLYHLD